MGRRRSMIRSIIAYRATRGKILRHFRYRELTSISHTYFAGNGKYLTHDNTIRRPTDRVVPGLAASK